MFNLPLNLFKCSDSVKRQIRLFASISLEIRGSEIILCLSLYRSLSLWIILKVNCFLSRNIVTHLLHWWTYIFRAVLQDEPGIVKRATHRVGLLTGLATKWSPVMHNAEPFQIVNYGIGGMYHPHYDSNVSVWNKN